LTVLDLLNLAGEDKW